MKTYSGCFQKTEISEYLSFSFQYMYSTIEDKAAPLKFMTLIVLMQSTQPFLFHTSSLQELKLDPLNL